MKSLLTSAALLLSTCAPVAAQDARCAPAQAGAEILSEQLGMTMVFAGDVSSGSAIEFWINHRQGAFAIVENNGAMRCMLATGDEYTYMPLGVDA